MLRKKISSDVSFTGAAKYPGKVPGMEVLL